MVLRREQDQAYLESLRQDQEKERIKNQKQEEQLQKERDIQRKKQVSICFLLLAYLIAITWN